jgi:hypothetical protein
VRFEKDLDLEQKDEETGSAWGKTLKRLDNLTREPVLGKAAAAVHPGEGESRQAPGAAQTRGPRHGRGATRGRWHRQRAVRRNADHATRTHS